MTSHRQLELEHAVLQERLSELEEARAADARDRCGQTAHMSAVSSADMYAQLANSSDWSARQMGAIEGTLTRMPHTTFSAPAKRCACKHLSGFLPQSTFSCSDNGNRQAACLSWEFQNWQNCFLLSGSRLLRLALRHR